jgi:hypothetical protein
MTEKTTTNTDSANMTVEHNPWTENLTGWQKHIKINGDLLPKRILRPYWLLPPVRIDDKQYVYPDGDDRKDLLNMIYGFAYIIAAGAALGWIVTGFTETTALLVTLICLAIALPIHSYEQKLKYNQYMIFDRERSIVRIEMGVFKKKIIERPFQECEGRLHRQAHVIMMHFALYLEHPDGFGGFKLLSTSTIDEPLGFWSFLVQYMDKSKPLPDIPYLENYPDREPGLGKGFGSDKKEWKKLEKQPDFVDPYIAWLSELQEHPEWDKLNYGRKFKTPWVPQLAIFIVVTALLMLAVILTT